MSSCVVRGVWCGCALGMWCVVCGVRCAACGVWCVVCGTAPALRRSGPARSTSMRRGEGVSAHRLVRRRPVRSPTSEASGRYSCETVSHRRHTIEPSSSS